MSNSQNCPTIEVPVLVKKHETFWFSVTPKLLDEYKCKSAEELRDKIKNGDFAPLGFKGNWDTDDTEILDVFTDDTGVVKEWRV